MAELQRPVRLSGGEVLIDAATAAMVRDLALIALDARRDLMTVRDAADAERRARLRDLFDALPTSASASDVGNAEVVDDDEPPSSVPVIATTSTQGAAGMLNVTRERVGQLIAAGRLVADRDAPGCPWRVHLDSIHAYIDQRDHQEQPA